jgi:hypothetical protein
VTATETPPDAGFPSRQDSMDELWADRYHNILTIASLTKDFELPAAAPTRIQQLA